MEENSFPFRPRGTKCSVQSRQPLTSHPGQLMIGRDLHATRCSASLQPGSCGAVKVSQLHATSDISDCLLFT